LSNPCYSTALPVSHAHLPLRVISRLGLVDGAALDPTSFGEEDADGYWNPIAYVTGAEPAAIGATWRGSYSSDSNAASYTNSGAALGTADADRYVIVAIPLFIGVSNLTISSVTIGGVSATKINGETFYSATSTNRSLVDFWKANVPTGTTGDIVITPSTTAPRMSASWWTCIGDVAIIDTQADIATNVTPDNSLTVTSKRPSNGFVLAAVTGQGDSGDPTFTWGGTGITEKHETGYGDTDGSHGSASGDFTAASTEAITVTNGLGDMYYYILSAVTFAPPGGDGAYGTNGGAYDFADSVYFGKDASVVDASATVISASGEWTVGTASITFSGDGWTYNATDDALYVTDTFAVASWPMSYQLALNGSVDNPGAAIGLFDNAEIGTFNHQNNSGGLDAMTASWRFRPSDGVLWYGATTVATLGARSINDILKFIVDADGTVRFFINEVLRHTFAQSATGKTLRLMSACSNTTSYDGCKWVTNIPGNSFSDSGFVAADQLADTPTDSAANEIGNYCKLDGARTGALTITEGGRVYTSTGAGSVFGTFRLSGGKWYWEFTATTATHAIGVDDGTGGTGISPGGSIYYFGNRTFYTANGNKYSEDDASTYGTAVSAGEVVGVALDMDNGAIWFSINGVWQDGDGTEGDLLSSDIAAYNAAAIAGAAFTDLLTAFGAYGTVYPIFGTPSASQSGIANFGDRDFAYTPPDGFLAPATFNLPATDERYTGATDKRAQIRAGAQVMLVSLTGNTSGIANYSIRQVLSATDIIDHAGSKVRFKLEGGGTPPAMYVDNMSVGIHTSGGSTAATPVPVTVGGNASFSIFASEVEYSDWVDLDISPGDAVVVIFDVGSTGSQARSRIGSGNGVYYQKASTDSYNVADISALSFSGPSTGQYSITRMEIQ
jgi:hypothetical protein